MQVLYIISCRCQSPGHLVTNAPASFVIAYQDNSASRLLSPSSPRCVAWKLAIAPFQWREVALRRRRCSTQPINRIKRGSKKRLWALLCWRMLMWLRAVLAVRLHVGWQRLRKGSPLWNATTLWQFEGFSPRNDFRITLFSSASLTCK